VLAILAILATVPTTSVSPGWIVSRQCQQKKKYWKKIRGTECGKTANLFLTYSDDTCAFPLKSNGRFNLADNVVTCPHATLKKIQQQK
jgi:hypothetical protein